MRGSGFALRIKLDFSDANAMENFQILFEPNA